MNENCGRLFGTVFSQVITDFNRATHVQTNDTQDKRRPFTRTELQQFFDLADLEPERILNSGRKGALAAWRDAVAFKVLYGWGLRAGEGRQLQLVDCSRNARAPGFGEWGLLRVRHGKAMRGSPAKQRAVLTVFDWAAEALATFFAGSMICVAFILWWLGQPTQCFSSAPLTSLMSDPADPTTNALCPGVDAQSDCRTSGRDGDGSDRWVRDMAFRSSAEP